MEYTHETLRALADRMRAHTGFHADVREHASAWEAELEAAKAREKVGDLMRDLLCRLFASPDYLVDRFAKETWKLMQDWTAPPVLAASEPPGEVKHD